MCWLMNGDNEDVARYVRHLILGFPFFFPLLPPGLPSSTFLTVPSQSILATCPTHYNLRTLITLKISEYSILLKFLDSV